jgi:pimeloyl-ACP methyl ester carboxylesterase
VTTRLPAAAAGVVVGLALVALTVTAPKASALDRCLGPGARVVHGVAVLGTGTRGVVLSNQSDEDLCSWAPFANTLARDGFRVALYDYGNSDPVAAVGAAAADLRSLGATRVALVGASEGAKASILAASRARVTAVVSLSAERYLGGIDVLPAAGRLTAPVLYLYAKADPYSESATPALFRATKERAKTLVALTGSGHGTALLPRVSGRIRAFLRMTLQHSVARSPSRSGLPSLTTRCARKMNATTFWFRASDGARLDGAMLGTGRTGVVLATEYPADLCDWIPEALVLRARGFRVVLFDFRGLGLSPRPVRITAETHYVDDVVGAARELRRRGASRVYLMGASLGATSSIVAATQIHPTVAGVVSLSGEADLTRSFPGSGLKAAVAAARLSMPVLYVAAHDDGLAPPADVRRFRSALRRPGDKVAVFPGSWHGWQLLYFAP